MSGHECELCQQVYTSYRAMMLCEEACIEENRDARRPNPRTIHRIERWDND